MVKVGEVCPATETRGVGYVAQLVPGQDSVRVHPGFLRRHIPEFSTGKGRPEKSAGRLSYYVVAQSGAGAMLLIV